MDNDLNNLLERKIKNYNLLVVISSKLYVNGQRFEAKTSRHLPKQ